MTRDSQHLDVERIVDQELDIRSLRAGFLRFSREMLARLALPKRARALDIGCGGGASTLEIARLTDADIVAIDIDDSALGELRAVVEREGLGERISVESVSLIEAPFAAGHFDLLWEEGVLHLIDPHVSLPICYRLLRPGGHLVCCETVEWIDRQCDVFDQNGLELAIRLLWPTRSWWDEYYAPLEERVRRLWERFGDHPALVGLRRHEDEIAMVRADPERFDCGHFAFRKVTRMPGAPRRGPGA